MALSKELKTQIVGDYGRKGDDTGSPEVQIALLSERIRQLTEHLKINKHDHSSRRGLLKLVGQRRRMMRYLAREDVHKYHQVISRLGIRDSLLGRG
jgi:small subunit ribosomal protein S15